MIEVDVRLDRGAFRLDCAFRSEADALALFGRSGSGKSTVLSLIAGLLRPDSGRIVVDGETLVDTDRGVFVPPHRRRVGVVFQDALLFPHLSVRSNLGYGRRFAGPSARAVDADALVGMLGIGHLLDRRPAGLSGGERQRVAIGRALLAGPRLLLLDEPLSALDFERRREIMPYVERLRDTLRWPLVYVSHAVDEVARIAREVVVLEQGRVAARGMPGEVLAPPGADGFGAVSVVETRIIGFDAEYGLTALEHPAGPISVPGRVGEPGEPFRVLVRATDVALAVQRPRDVSFRTVLVGTIGRVDTDASPTARIEIALRGEGRLVALVTRRALDELALDVGDEVFAMLKATALDERALAFAPRVR
ncbi:MAG: molybdenum ABC transporter ATP-binding protein [Burkholderiales bacterium]